MHHMPGEQDLRRCLALLTRAFAVLRDECDPGDAETNRFCGVLADELHNLPELLLQYRDFDEQRFWRDVRGGRRLIPDRFAASWFYVFGRGGQRWTDHTRSFRAGGSRRPVSGQQSNHREALAALSRGAAAVPPDALADSLYALHHVLIALRNELVGGPIGRSERCAGLAAAGHELLFVICRWGDLGDETAAARAAELWKQLPSAR
jgi:hypothetical protein